MPDDVKRRTQCRSGNAVSHGKINGERGIFLSQRLTALQTAPFAADAGTCEKSQRTDDGGYESDGKNFTFSLCMTDTHIADKVYMEPLTLEYVAKIIRYERPDAIVPGLGGQTGLNLAVQLAKKGILEECGVEILGTSFTSIEEAEDRELFKELCMRIGEPVIPSHITSSIEEGVKAAEDIGYPVVLRPAFTLGGTGGGFADNEDELRDIMRNALALSPIHQVLVEKSIKGYKEIEFEVMRDKNDTAIAICSMENVDPVGIHTGDSIVSCRVRP